MLVCPKCHIELIEKNCNKCLWKVEYKEGLENFVHSSISRAVKDYIELYQKISIDDIEMIYVYFVGILYIFTPQKNF